MEDTERRELEARVEQLAEASEIVTPTELRRLASWYEDEARRLRKLAKFSPNVDAKAAG